MRWRNRQRGRGGETGRKSHGTAIQTRAADQDRGSQPQPGNRSPLGPLGNQLRQPPGVLATDGSGPDLLRMWEEEKLARDVYTSLAKTSKSAIFRNISRAESQHMQSVERLLRSAGANAVQLNDTPGVFVFPEYQRLYQSLLASGTRSPLDALRVGARIEEMDIADVTRMLTQTTDPQVRQVLERLLQGSQSHLRAFASQITRQGASYSAEFLTQAEFDQIATSSGQGQGQQSAGRGAGNRGRGSQSSGQQFGPQFHGNGGQGPGSLNQSGQAGPRQGAGQQGSGGSGQVQGQVQGQGQGRGQGRGRGRERNDRGSRR